MVMGLYDQKWGTNDSTFIMLKDSHPIFMHSHLVRVVKFLMPLKDYRVSGNDPMYELNEKAISSIKSILTSLDDD